MKCIYCCVNNARLLIMDKERGSVLVFSTQVRGIKPGRSRLIFQNEKILSTPFFGGEVKPSVPCRRFTACKRILDCTWKSVSSRLNSRLSFSPTNYFHFSLLGALTSCKARRDIWRQKLGTS